MKSIVIGTPDDIHNRTIIIVDDMADTMGTMISTATELEKLGAKGCIIVVTHGYFSDGAIEKLNSVQFIKYVVCTNSIDQTENIKKTNKIFVVDISDFICDVVIRLETGQSISELFK